MELVVIEHPKKTVEHPLSTIHNQQAPQGRSCEYTTTGFAPWLLVQNQERSCS